MLLFSIIIILFNLHFSNSQNYILPQPSQFERNRPIRPDPPEIKYAYILEDCRHYGNSTAVEMDPLILVNRYGLRVTWSRNQEDKFAFTTTPPDLFKGFDDIRGIYDCTITIKLGPHDKLIAYQELIFGFIYWISLDSEVPYAKSKADAVARLDPENTIANRGLKELQRACRPAKASDASGISCDLLGCIIITYGNKTKATCYEYDGKNIGDDNEWFTRDDVTIRVLLIGTFIGKDRQNKNVNISFPVFNTHITVDFTRLYAGPCENLQQFYCPTHGVCIKYALACDPISMTNCPKYGSNRDESILSTCDKTYVDSIPPLLNKPDPGALQNLLIFWILIGLLLAFLTFLILNYLFWRPGYLIWRLGRLRNWFNFGNSCYKTCHSCSKGDCAQCCKTQGKFDTIEPVTVAWSKFSMGDGFHMRENR